MMTVTLQQSDDDLQNPVQQDKHSAIFPENTTPSSLFPFSHLYHVGFSFLPHPLFQSAELRGTTEININQ